MSKLKLAAKNNAEKRVLAYLEENASEALSGKINAGTATLAHALKYCADRAKKESADGAGCACVDDAEVFGWVVHFFEEKGNHADVREKKGAEKIAEEPADEEPAADINPEAVEEEEEEEEEEAVGEDAGLFGGIDLLGGGK